MSDSDEMNSLYAKRSIGVLGAFKDERSKRDMQLQQEYGLCNKEGWNKDSGAGVTEIPDEYKFGFEQRSVRDKQMLADYSGCRKEGFQKVRDASISDNPYNKLATNAQRVPVGNLNKH